MKMNFKPSVIFSFILLFAALLQGCNPPVTVDKPANELTVKISVADTTENPSDQKVPVFMQFFVGGSYVKLASTATLKCNGVTLNDQGVLGYAERVPMQQAGGTYSFVHSRAGVNTTVNVTIPARPVITSPAAGSSVPRTNNLTINYAAANAASVYGSASDSSTGKTGTHQPDNGTYTGLNVTDLNAGAGKVGIIREIETTHSGTGFLAAESKYNSGNHVSINWA